MMDLSADTPTTPATATNSAANLGRPKSGKSRMSQEKIMLVMGLFFFGGVAIFTLMPEEGAALRGLVMTFYTVGLLYALIKLCNK